MTNKEKVLNNTTSLTDSLYWVGKELHEAKEILHGILADDGLSTELGEGWSERIKKFLDLPIQELEEPDLDHLSSIMYGVDNNQ